MATKSEATRIFGWRESLCPLAAGLLGGAVSTTLLLPLDVIKVHMQVHEQSSTTAHKTSANPSSSPKTIKRLNSIRLVRGILRHEGWMGLYQGLTPAVVGASVAWGGYFFFYEGFKHRLARYYKNRLESESEYNGVSPPSVALSSLDNFGLACGAGAVMVFITNPIWLIKTRMQLQLTHAAKKFGARKEPYRGLFDAARTIVREEGFWALYKGTVPALLLTSHGGVQFVVYEYLKLYFDFKRIPRNSEDGAKPVIERLKQSLGYLSMGAVAKIAASTATYPLQVIKARIQQRSESLVVTAEGNVRLVRREYSGMVKTITRMWRKEGLSGFFKGCIPNAIRVAPGAAITFVIYESAMDWCS